MSLPLKQQRRPIPKPPLKSRQQSIAQSLHSANNIRINSNILYNEDSEKENENNSQSTITTSTVNGTGTVATDISRALFKSVVLKHRNSLTNPEQSFLEFLVDQGDEDDLNTAMMVLSDQSLFPNPEESCYIDGNSDNCENCDTRNGEEGKGGKEEKNSKNDGTHSDWVVSTPISDRKKATKELKGTGSTRNTDLNNNHDTMNENTSYPTENAFDVSQPYLNGHHTGTKTEKIRTFDNRHHDDQDGASYHTEDAIDLSQSCINAFSLSFGGDCNRGPSDDGFDDIIQETVKVEGEKIKKRFGLLDGTKRFLNLSSKELGGEDVTDCGPSSQSYENVEVVEIAGKPFVLQDCNVNQIVSSPTGTTAASGNTSTASSPSSVSLKCTPIRSNMKHRLSEVDNNVMQGQDKLQSNSSLSDNATIGANIVGLSSNGLSIVKPSEVDRRPSLTGSGISLGSSKRRCRVAERRTSRAHSGMWRAHESGVSLTYRSVSPSMSLKQNAETQNNRPSSNLRRHIYAHHRNRRLSSIEKNRLGPPILSSSIKNLNSSMSSIPGIQTANPLDSSGNLLNFPGTSTPMFSDSTMSSFPAGTQPVHTQQQSSDSLMTFPGLLNAPAFRSSLSLREAIEGSSFNAIPSLPSYNLRDSSYGSLHLANPLESSTSSLTRRISFTRQFSNQSKQSLNDSFEYLDLNTHKQKWLNAKARKQGTSNYVTNDINDELNYARDSIASLDLACEIGGRSSSNSLFADYPMRSSNSLPSMDLANTPILDSSLTLPSDFDEYPDSSKSITLVRQEELFHRAPNETVLQTIHSEDIIEHFPKEISTPNIRNNRWNLQMMRARSLMSHHSSSKSSFDDSFFVSSSTNLWMKPGIAFDDSEIRSCKSDETSVYVKDRGSLLSHPCLVEDDLSCDLPRGYNDEKWTLSEYEEYGYDMRLEFKILGTSADDVESHPHVLSPPLMDSLFQFLPFAVSEENFWMKYSLVKDGASFFKLLQNIRSSTSTLIAIETVDGEVFGSFTSSPWRKSTSFFGSGEAFLWRMRSDRKMVCKSVIDQAQLESEIEVYPWTSDNYLVQLCTDKSIVVGGGASRKARESDDSGFGLFIDGQMLHGTSQHTATFDNPPLSKEHQDGSPFEIVNLEVWTLTPAMSVEEAEKIEFGRLFLELNKVDGY